MDHKDETDLLYDTRNLFYIYLETLFLGVLSSPQTFKKTFETWFTAPYMRLSILPENWLLPQQQHHQKGNID